MLIWRTPIGQISYMIKWVLYEQNYNKIGSLHIDREDIDHCIYMLYSEEYIKSIIKKLGAESSFLLSAIKILKNLTILLLKNLRIFHLLEQLMECR